MRSGAGATAAGNAIPLAAMQPGEAGVVVDLRPGAHNQVQKCLALGILPGASVTVRRRSPSFVFDIGFSQFAVDEEMANVVLVQPDQRR
jgi:Fe2+ transport system protein FeoA